MMQEKEVVHCETQEQWNIVNNKLPSDRRLINNWDSYEEKSCIDFNNFQYSGIDWFQGENYKIYSFDEWFQLIELKEKNYVLPEYWKLNITEANIESINNWRIGVFDLSGDISNKDWIYSTGRTNKPLMSDEYKQISSHVFDNYVLKNAVYKFTNKNLMILDGIFAKLGIE